MWLSTVLIRMTTVQLYQTEQLRMWAALVMKGALLLKQA